MLLSLTGCDNEKTSSKKDNDKKPQQSNSQTAEDDQNKPEGDIQNPVDNPGDSNNTHTNENNYFLNENNNILEKDALTIRPKYVYWKDGKLIAVCYVINGFSHNVFNINVKSLSFANKNGAIASASFGGLNNLSLAPNTHAEWTFEFNADCIQNYGADITSLQCTYSTSNSY